MYHQFKELGNIDITKEPMEVGPTTHYIMGGVRVDGDTQMSTVPGLFAAANAPAGINGANRLGGNSLSDLLVFGKRAGEYAAKYAKEHPATARSTTTRSRRPPSWALEPFDRARRRRKARIKVQHDLQEMMQDLVGIVRKEDEMLQALEQPGSPQAAGRARSARSATASTTPAGTPPSTCTTC